MNPSEFKKRFQGVFADRPEWLGFDLGKFRSFSQHHVDRLGISEKDKDILRVVGFPEEAAPFLSFTFDFERMNELQPNLGGEFCRFRVMGQNGAGDYVSIDERDGSICYHNHDNRMQRVFINSSLGQFAETLCSMAEAVQSRYTTDFFAILSRVDPDAAKNGAFWSVEYELMKK